MYEFSIKIGRSKKKEEPTPTPVLTAKEQEERDTELLMKALRQEDKNYARLDEDGQNTPVVGGRSSVPQAMTMFGGGRNTPVATDYPFEHVKYIQQLAMWNRHIGQAVENIVSLGNTNYEISFDEAVPDEMAEEMRKRLRMRADQWYQFSEGENSLDTDLLAQLATTGCISAEAVPSPQLDGVSKIVRVDPYNVRFSYDRELDEYMPLQKVDFLGVPGMAGTRANNGYVELNPATYCYMAMRRFNELPYAIPPFLTAVEDVIIENDMVKNFANMMRRLGLMGFLQVLYKTPQRNNNEDDTAYYNRLLTHLETHRSAVEKGFHQGVIMGYQNEVEFDVTTHPASNVSGDFMNQVHKLIYAGVKQDPAMHGENFSTTETFARVILAKMATQVKNYQKTLAEFKARVFLLDLRLGGFPVDMVKVEYEPATISDRKHEAEAEKLEIENANSLYNQGVIDQNERANRLGYDEPAEDEPRMTAPEVGEGGESNSPARQDETGDATSTSENVRRYSDRSINSLLVRLGAGGREYAYDIPEACQGHDHEHFIDVSDFNDPALNRFARRYANDVSDLYDQYVKRAVASMHTSIRKMRSAAGEVEAANRIKYELYAEWQNRFANPVQDIITKHIEPMYAHYRKDDKVFTDAPNYTALAAEGQASGMSFFEIPAPVFELIDTRAVEFLEGIDRYWLGKFITDEDTIKRVNSFIQAEMLSKNLEIGPNSQALHSFIDRFGDMVLNEEFKIRRILETTANKVRATGNILYMNQAAVQDYEIVEVGDTRTCEWCFYVNGKTFQVAPTIDKIQKLTERDFQNLPEISPFATATPIEQFTKLDEVTLQSMGIDSPPFHPHCRGRVVAKL